MEDSDEVYNTGALGISQILANRIQQCLQCKSTAMGQHLSLANPEVAQGGWMRAKSRVMSQSCMHNVILYTVQIFSQGSSTRGKWLLCSANSKACSLIMPQDRAVQILGICICKDDTCFRTVCIGKYYLAQLLAESDWRCKKF